MIRWYLPSLYGDIRLESQGKNQTLVTIHGLSVVERVAVESLLKKAAKPGPFKKPWAPAEVLESVSLINTVKEQKLSLEASITDVEKVLSSKLKPARKQVSVVRFQGGKIEEVTEATIGLIEAASEMSPAETSTTTSSPKAEATTVAKPVLGCPAPDFDAVDVRATEALSAFLTDEQREDFRLHQAFIVMGADTGHRYQLTSRHARTKLATVRRTLFDLDENRPYCVHDWDVPAAEELLAIMLFLALRGREHYLRHIPE